VDLARWSVDQDAPAFRCHRVVGMEDDGDGGGVHELAALKPDQDQIVLGGGSLERLLKLVCDRQVDLASTWISWHPGRGCPSVSRKARISANR